MSRHLPLAVAVVVAVVAVSPSPAQVPKTFPPDAATLKQIEAKTAELRKAIDAFPPDIAADVRADVEVYHKAAEWIVRHGEWLQKDSWNQTLAVLDAGIDRAKAAAAGKTPWRDVRGKPVVLGYKSLIDGSIQPYRLTLPVGYEPVVGKRSRLDVVLHGRDGTLNEIKFIHATESDKAGGHAGGVILEPYGRGNIAYRWAGELDVLQAEFDIRSRPSLRVFPDYQRKVLRGFSMGGAGTWHIGLHHPFLYSVIGPGAGFTTTHGYIKSLPPRLPEYQEKCLHIYDAVDYAENAFNVPVVAYSGANDPQKAAADNIETALKEFKEPIRFTHLVAPGLAHKMPAEWQAKAEAEYLNAMKSARPTYGRVRFVTYTSKYGNAGWATIQALDRQYEKAVLDGTWDDKTIRVITTNVRAFQILGYPDERPLPAVVVDGHPVRTVPPTEQEIKTLSGRPLTYLFGKDSDDKWVQMDSRSFNRTRLKRNGLQGPIEDAFTQPFSVAGPTRPGWSPDTDGHARASATRLTVEWDKWMRGKLNSRTDSRTNILFGDPQSNPQIARVLPHLPITWTEDRLVVNGIEYDAKSHVPVLIYPLFHEDPDDPNAALSRYVVLNSGHTFHDADFRGTNALLYPRLGDWAVLKPTPTKDDPAAAEVVAAGLFDENWQFVKTPDR